MKRHLSICLSIGLFFTQPQAFATNDNWTDKVDPVLMSKTANGDPVEMMVIMAEQADLSAARYMNTKEEKGNFVFHTLQDLSTHTQPVVWEKLESLHAPYHSYFIVNAVWTKGDIDVIRAMAEMPQVSQVIENARYTVQQPVQVGVPSYDDPNTKTNAVEWAISLVKADQVWGMGYKGQGAVVGGQDSGYEWDHPAIKGKYRGWNGSSADHNHNWHDAIQTGNGGSCGTASTEPCDDHGHGTHTMGTMVGDDGAGNQVGMAPDAEWIGCRNMDQGAGTFATYAECFEWFIAPTDLNDQNPMPSKSPDVINNSWGCPTDEGCNTSNFEAMRVIVSNVKDAGIVVVASAGNSGPSCNTVEDPPAMYDESFSVGSTTSSDNMSSFSSRGNVTVDGSNRMKPDISAPGSDIRSSYPGGGYTSMSGTSMAGPHVAGLVALIISANPDLAGKVDIIEDIIEKTAVKLSVNETCGGVAASQVPNNTFGYGRINALDAINEVILTVGQLNPESQGKAKVFPNPMHNNSVVYVPVNGSSIA
ncbi:MAG: S8 family serine peptidase, partial [Flavobacteriales bacterium]|nr:S8 family serine peptidase [Flavobacteriales bacterium]